MNISSKSPSSFLPFYLSFLPRSVESIIIFSSCFWRFRISSAPDCSFSYLYLIFSSSSCCYFFISIILFSWVLTFYLSSLLPIAAWLTVLSIFWYLFFIFCSYFFRLSSACFFSALMFSIAYSFYFSTDPILPERNYIYLLKLSSVVCLVAMLCSNFSIWLSFSDIYCFNCLLSFIIASNYCLKWLSIFYNSCLSCPLTFYDDSSLYFV